MLLRNFFDSPGHSTRSHRTSPKRLTYWEHQDSHTLRGSSALSRDWEVAKPYLLPYDVYHNQ